MVESAEVIKTKDWEFVGQFDRGCLDYFAYKAIYSLGFPIRFIDDETMRKTSISVNPLFRKNVRSRIIELKYNPEYSILSASMEGRYVTLYLLSREDAPTVRLGYLRKDSKSINQAFISGNKGLIEQAFMFAYEKSQVVKKIKEAEEGTVDNNDITGLHELIESSKAIRVVSFNQLDGLMTEIRSKLSWISPFYEDDIKINKFYKGLISKGVHAFTEEELESIVKNIVSRLHPKI